MPAETAVRVLIAEPDDLIGQILTTALGDTELIVERYAGSRDGLFDVARTAKVLALGPGVPRAGLDAVIPRIVAGGTRVLIIADERFDDSASDLLFAGATGFVSLADGGATDVARAVAAVAAGSTALNADVVRQVLLRWREQRGAEGVATVELTTRESEVLAGLRDGLTTRLLAKRLGVSEKTIDAHKSRLFAKLGARNQAHAVQLAAERGLG